MAEGTWRSQGPTGPPGVTRQVSDRRVEPPLVIQNAMLTKDKKPFTYTPGGIDLSEIKSPRMARRIERNANAPGVGDIPRVSPPRGPTEPLPPSAIAAMQPALPVQVLPAGAVPPPPPPPMNIPPPPPMDPLPTKVVTTNEGIFERPDMTKIIPENPMALLRKTGGVNRRSFIEEPAYSDFQPQVNNQQNYITPQIYMPETQARQPVQVQQSAPSQFRQVPPQAQVQPQQQYTQPKPQMATVPRQESYQEQPQEIKTSTAQLGQLYIPPLNNDNQRNIASPPVKVVTPSAKVSNPPSPQQRVPQSPAQSPGSPQSPMATLNRAPRPWQAQKPPTTEVPPWAHKSHTSPPSSPGEEEEEEEEEEAAIVQQSPQINYQKRAVPQSPGVQQNFMNQQSPQRVPPSPGFQQQQQQNFNHQQRMPQQQPNVQPNVIGRVIIPVQMDAPPSSPNVEAVYVTQPIVLQHPGPIPDGSQQSIKEQQLRQQQQLQQQKLQQQQLQQQKLQQQQQLQQQQRQHQYQQQQSQSTRIIPIQIEGGTNNNGQSSTPNSVSVGSATPGSARTFNRQPSWSQTGPTQSNSFKVLQKITNTDGDEDENEESTEHEPRRSQQFEQPPLDQVRKLKLSEDDQELMNKLKQVPRNPQVGNQGPTVRTIPVQIEGEATGKPYIPPSEQTVPEPKKYTGGKIPSRSFKVLQAMTGEACGPDQSDL